jgi:hypothetical protein
MRISFEDKLQDADWLRAFNNIATLAYISMAWTCVLSTRVWKTQYHFMLLILGLVLAAGFVLTGD